ncbi:MAG TPA: FHA domain-containing protein, partial [Azospira sp.]|nr:FHA domain-containing protein [Azospira sp.]
MAKLVLSIDGLVLKEIPLSKDRMTIGRKSHNDIQIENLAISGEHAVLVTVLNDSFIEDLNSTNGTLVNGQPIRKHFLQNGDLIEMGKYQIKFITEAAVARDDTSAAGHAVGARPDLAPPTASAEPIFPAQTPRSSPGDTLVGGPGAVPQLGSIRVLNGANAGKELEL